MMSRSVADARGWMQHGTALFISQTDLGDCAPGEPSALPGWSRRHVLAHIAANADALGNLVRWAATGEPTPMYASPAERTAGIERGRQLPAGELKAWLRRSADALEEAMARLSGQQWQAPVLTAQGRSVPATEVPWMRSREVYVHAVDLATGLSFDGLPAGFLTALCDDVIDKRSKGPRPALVLAAIDTGGQWKLPGDGEAVTVAGPLAEITAYLTGRAHRLTTTGGGEPPVLAPWL
jgi:uncharacterized protein (TIGR03083 family)